MTHTGRFSWRSGFAGRAGALLLALGCVTAFAGHAQAQDFALVDAAGDAVGFERFREDGKFTLFMIRFNGCRPCDEAEQALQEWFSRQDEDQVSVLALNLDDGDVRASTAERLDVNRIRYPNFFTDDQEAVQASIAALTDRPLRGVPTWLFFGPDGAFIDGEVGVEFDWETLDEMLAAAPAGLPSLGELAAPPTVPAPTAEDVRSGKIVGQATLAMIRGDLPRARRWLDDELAVNPEHHGLITERARLRLLARREAADTPLGHRLSNEDDERVEAALEKVLAADATHPRASYLLAELHATQGRLEEAERVIGFPETLDANSRYRAYVRAVLRIMQGRQAEAVEIMKRLTDLPFQGPEQYYIFQRAWERLKTVVIRQPDLDPMTLAREGLVTRVSETSLLGEIRRRGESETPLLVIVSSEDPGCSYCVDAPAGIESFVRANKDKYDVIYATVEPWRNIEFEAWAHLIPDFLAVPKAALFARSRFMSTAGLPNSEEQIAWYDEIYPRMLTEDPRLWNYPKREARAELSVAYRRWLKAELPVSAFASILVEDKVAWGTSDARDVTQAEADRQAMAVCTERAASEEIDQPCALFVAPKD